MGLQKSNFIILAIVCAISIIVMVLVISIFYPRQLQKLECHDASLDMMRAAGLVSLEIEQTALDCFMGAAWDDTYQFIQDNNSDYLTVNMMDETFIDLRLNYILFFDASGNEVFSKGFDLSSATVMPVPETLKTEISNNLLMHEARPGDVTGGIITVETTPLMIASAAITDSSRQQPVLGTLIFSRIINEDVEEKISQIAFLPITLHRFTEPDLNVEVIKGLDEISSDEPVYTWVKDGSTIGGIVILEDIKGNPALILESEIERTSYPAIATLQRDLLITIIIVIIAAGAASIFMLRRGVLKPLADLSSHIKNISMYAALDKRLPIKGKDEIAQLGRGVNEMLDMLQETQNALTESAEKYRDLFENAHDLIQSVDNEGKFLYTNPAWRETLGYTQEETASLVLQDIIHPDSMAHCMEIFKHVINGENIQTVEAAFVSKEGKTIHVIGSASCRFIDGTPAYTRGIFHDITDLREARMALEDMLEHEKQLNQQLQDEIRLRIDTVRIITHELKNSLTSLMASSELLTELAGDEAGNYQTLARNISRSTRHLNKRVREMLDMARVEMGTLNIQQEPVDLVKLLNNVVLDVTPLTESRKQRIELLIPEELPLIFADPDRLGQVCLNLLDNASRYTPENGLITVSARVEKPFMVISVTDTGKGIEKDAQEDLFTSYGKIDRRTGNISGLGLGLALCRSFVELHSGRIWVESEPGHGSTFLFTMPLYHEPDHSRE